LLVRAVETALWLATELLVRGRLNECEAASRRQATVLGFR